MTKDPKVFADYYAHMPDEDLQRLSLDVQSLLPEAREALRCEIERRQIPAASIDWQAQPIQEDQGPQAQSRTFTRNLTLFIIFEVVCLAFIIWVLPGGPGIDSKQLPEFVLKAGVLLMMLLSALATRFSIPLRLKIILVISVCAPIALLFLYVEFR